MHSGCGKIWSQPVCKHAVLQGQHNGYVHDKHDEALALSTLLAPCVQATITNEKNDDAHPLKAMKFSVSPVVRVAVEPKVGPCAGWYIGSMCAAASVPCHKQHGHTACMADLRPGYPWPCLNLNNVHLLLLFRSPLICPSWWRASSVWLAPTPWSSVSLRRQASTLLQAQASCTWRFA